MKAKNQKEKNNAIKSLEKLVSLYGGEEEQKLLKDIKEVLYLLEE